MYEREIGLTTLDARNYGALGNGLHDDTYAIQCALNALPPSGGTVVLAKGVFPVLPKSDGALKMRDRCALSWQENAKMMLLPTDAERDSAIEIRGTSENMLINPSIVGNRDDGLGTTGEWGHGVAVRGAKHLSIIGGNISRCWGDGISVGSNVTEHSEDVIIAGLTCDSNRRQGLTIARVRGIQVLDSVFCNTFGTDPQAGIDVEPDSPGESFNTLIKNCKVFGNAKTGILVWRRSEPNLAIRNVVIEDCDVFDNGVGVWTYGGVNVIVRNNRITENMLHGLLFDTGSDYVQAVLNRFGYNYRKNAIKVRAEKTATGKPTGTNDIMVRGATNVAIGENTYLAQTARVAGAPIPAAA